MSQPFAPGQSAAPGHPAASAHPATPGHPGLAGQPASTAVPAVSCRGLTKTYGRAAAQVQALAGIDADFARGEFTAIMGPSGSGKSTLMHLLAGLDTPSEGQVAIEGRVITGMQDAELTRLRRDRIGFVFQSFNLVPTLTARENITLPIRLAGRRVDQQAVDALAAKLGVLDRLAHLPHELSGGQQQRIAIARALITEPAVVFADEPTGALDVRTGRELLASLKQAVRERAQTVVMVTHDPAAAAFADRVLILVDGHLEREVRGADYEQISRLMAGVGA